jgi:N utilization substance protein B
MQAIFAHEFGNLQPSKDRDLIISSLPEIDQKIAQNAPKWPLDKINKVDLAILRVALWELIYQSHTPPKVVIDEAVELAKEFGADHSPSFVNGVLGSALKSITSTHESTE